MATIEARVSTIEGTLAARGTSGGHELVVDRPAGVAGGAGSGFNGGQLLALALAGCLANDLRYVADDDGVELVDLEVVVQLEVDGGRVTSAQVLLQPRTADEATARVLAARAEEVSTVLAAVREGFAVEVTAG